MNQLLQAIVASIIAAITVTIVVCLAIWGAAKYVDLSQEGRTVAAGFALAVGVFGLVATIAIIVLGIALMVAG